MYPGPLIRMLNKVNSNHEYYQNNASNIYI